MEGEDWSDWTSCEFYGHDVHDGKCRDCGEEIEEERGCPRGDG